MNGVFVEPHVNDRGHAWVEISLAPDTAHDLARAIATRLHDRHLARSVSLPILTAQIARVITDSPVEMSAEEADDLGHYVIGEAAHAASPEYAEAVLGA